jgi:acyl-CoA-dependent ceramide synthase
MIDSLLRNIVERWAPEQGQWLTGWMKYQIFIPLFLLLLLNLFWTFLIFRVAYRSVKFVLMSSNGTDVSS